MRSSEPIPLSKHERSADFVLSLMELVDKLMVEGDLGGHIAKHALPRLFESREHLEGYETKRAYAIPGARAVGRFFAKYSVRAYMMIMRGGFEPSEHANDNETFDYADELEEVPGYAADLLGFVAEAIKLGLDVKSAGRLYFMDPLNGEIENAQLLKQ